MNEEATIELKRRWNFAGAISRFKLFVDDKKIGTISNGKTESFKIPPGTHSIYVKGAFWSKTSAIQMQAAPGSISKFECGITKSYWIFMICIIGLLIFGRTLIHSFAQTNYMLGLFFSCFLIIAAVVATVYTFRPNSVYYLKEISKDTIVN